MKRVVITGMGALSPIGMDVASLWESICRGRHGFTKIEGFSAAEMGITYSAQIHGFDPAAYGIPKKEARRMDAYTQYAVVAARQAVESSGYLLGEEDPYRVGVMIGSGVGGFNTIRAEHAKFLEKGPGRVSVFFVPMMIANMAAGTVAIEHGFKGVNFATVTACSSGAHAIGEAFRAIKHGYIDCAVAGGSEACIDQLSMAGFHNMGALARGEDPDRLSIPFDGERNGFVMAEGAGMLFLEEYEHAKRRGAHIFGEIAGYGATGDAYHITSPAPSGEGAAKAMQLAVEESGLTLQDVGYINAHGTATVLNDQCETKAIKLAFGEWAKKLAVSSTKSMTGHMLGAAGAVEAIICLKALEEGIIPPTANYRVADPECDLDYVSGGARKAPALRCAISNAFGFGGHNATLCFKKYEGEA